MADEAQTELEKVLEAGWQALDRGASEEARRASERAVALDASSAEAQTLAGAVASGEGDLDAALSAFQKAMTLDTDYFEPALLAAQLTAAAGDLEAGLALAEQALDRADEEEEYLDALLFKAELELAIEDRRRRRRDPRRSAAHRRQAARGRLPRARRRLLLRARRSRKRRGPLPLGLERLAPDLGDAQHGLALVAEAAATTRR